MRKQTGRFSRALACVCACAFAPFHNAQFDCQYFLAKQGQENTFKHAIHSSKKF